VHIVNFPFEALEEAIVNAFYHRSYEHENPIEINVWPDKIEILSFPGPLPPIDNKMLKHRRIVARNYRNRRIGDFLKELRLTEGRATGFPTIYSAMEKNGSPKPVFETDDEKTYFLTVLPVHPSFVEKPGGKPTEEELRILYFCLEPKKRARILKELSLSNHYRNYVRHIVPLLETGWLAMTIPNKPNSRNQRYMTIKKGKDILK
jgi:ATP-dependent DNA helicase RecG